jgi:hypothetical protein
MLTVKCFSNCIMHVEELDSPAVSALGVRSRKLSNALNAQSWDGWPKPYHLELLRASEGTLSRWFRLHLQSLAPTNPHWARVVGYGPSSLWVIHKEGLCPSSGDSNRLMMIMYVVSRVVSGAKYKNSTFRFPPRKSWKALQFDISANYLDIRTVQSSKCMGWCAVDCT